MFWCLRVVAVSALRRLVDIHVHTAARRAIDIDVDFGPRPVNVDIDRWPRRWGRLHIDIDAGVGRGWG
jgi:hypothetical protein